MKRFAGYWATFKSTSDGLVRGDFMKLHDSAGERFGINEYFGYYSGHEKTEYAHFLEQMQAMKAAKLHFMQTGEILPIVRQPIASSWKGCVARGLDAEHLVPYHKIPAHDLTQLCDKNRFLIDVASAIIKTICRTIKKVNFCIQLFNESGCLLYVNDAQNDNNPVKLDFKIGYCALDKSAVTGAVAMALEYKENFSVYGPEHYFSAFENLNCDSVLIHSNDRKIIGVINVVYDIESINTLLPSLATTVAALIEQQFINDRYSSIINQTMDDIAEGVLIVDSDLNVIKANRKFLNIINIEESALSVIDVAALFKEVDFDSIRSGADGHIAINEIMISYHSNHFRLNVNISPIYSGNYFDGFIILCREIKDIINLSQKFTGNHFFDFSSIITQDKGMLELIRNCQRVASLKLPILLEGASGTGKELFAQSIHNASPRTNKPFVAVNCAALPINLVESELFGYEKGAFTGALSTGKAGKFEQADGGTIFLDELGELPLDIQAKLLRVLDNHRLTRMGGNTEKKLDIRVIAATNRELYNEVILKNFREDLYYRLNVMNFYLPPLKERSCDIALLTNHFLDHLNQVNIGAKQISNQAMETLNSHKWTGNVRELQNTITRAYYLCEGELISCDHLPAYMMRETIAPVEKEAAVLKTSVQGAERNTIVEALQNCNGNVKEAAAQLDIPLSTLYKKIKLYDIINVGKLYK
jgi:transcriptional regulator with PAS, ATPase and Fis domain